MVTSTIVTSSPSSSLFEDVCSEGAGGDASSRITSTGEGGRTTGEGERGEGSGTGVGSLIEGVSTCFGGTTGITSRLIFTTLGGGVGSRSGICVVVTHRGEWERREP